LGHSLSARKTLWFETFGMGAVPESGFLDWTLFQTLELSGFGWSSG